LLAQRRYVLLLITMALSITALTAFPVHALNESYNLTASPPRLQEGNAGRVLLILNVSNANTLANYAFTWNVRDPSGALHLANNQTGPSHPASFVLSAAYPTRFNGSPTLAYAGVYSVWVNQTQPPIVGSTGIANSQFQVGLTDALSYQRLSPVSIQAVGYLASANVTIKISGPSGMVGGFPLNKTTDSGGSLSFVWAAIPVSLPVGDYTLTLTGTPVKSPPDTQSFTITATSVTISSLIINKSLLQTSQTEDFRFTATYPNLAPVRTGSVTLRLLEGDAVTTHYVTMTYSTGLSAFHGTFQIPLRGEAGPWVGTLDVNSFDDGYGNKGPNPSVIKAFTVTLAILTVSANTNYNNYTVGGIVAIYASVVTPGGYNFTSGTVTAKTYHGTIEIGTPLSLFYDQSRGKWVGSYTINSTDPSGVWQIQVSANDTYGNAGQGSTSTLVSVPAPSPQQSSTFDYLLVMGVASLVGLAVLGSWLVFGRKRNMRRVLKVDLEAVHSEAKKIENQEFFKNVQEQLRQEKISKESLSS
jgi:hypothetical protein